MARKRLSDVAGVQAMPAPGGMGETHHSKSVRPIENGFICSESTHTSEGYHHREYYSKTHPENREGRRDSIVGPENLKGAMRVLKE